MKPSRFELEQHIKMAKSLHVAATYAADREYDSEIAAAHDKYIAAIKKADDALTIMVDAANKEYNKIILLEK